VAILELENAMAQRVLIMLPFLKRKKIQDFQQIIQY